MVLDPWVTVKGVVRTVFGISIVTVPSVESINSALKIVVRAVWSYLRLDIAELAETEITFAPTEIVWVSLGSIMGNVAPEGLSAESK
jgi:hypothetical protein